MSEKRLNLSMGTTLVLLVVWADSAFAQQLPANDPRIASRTPLMRDPGVPLRRTSWNRVAAVAATAPALVDHSNCAACHRPARPLPRYLPNPCGPMSESERENLVRPHLPILISPGLPVAVLPVPRERLASEPPPRERRFPDELLAMLRPKGDDAPQKLSIKDLSVGLERSSLSAERNAESKLKLAQLLSDQGEKEDAKRYHREIVRQYPATAAAAESRRALGLAPPDPTDDAQPERARLSRPEK